MKTATLTVLMATVLTGCAVTAPGHLYPLQGPLATGIYESTPEHIETAAGTALDSRGNLYKVTF